MFPQKTTHGKQIDAHVHKPCVNGKPGGFSSALAYHRFREIEICCNRQPTCFLPEQKNAHHKFFLLLEDNIKTEITWEFSSYREHCQVIGQHLIFVESGIRHSLKWEKAASFICLLLHDELFTQMTHDSTWRGIQIRECNELEKGDLLIWYLAYILQKIIKSELSDEPTIFIEAICIILANQLFKKTQTDKQPLLVSTGLSSEQLRIVRSYIHDHLCETVLVPHLAEIIDMSKDHFTRLFKNTMGVTPHRYILLKRLQLAQSLIVEGKMRLSEIALAVGFCDQSHLSRNFRKFCAELSKQGDDGQILG
ncbi:AraC family transcriptional regulator [Ereboglobus sp. PH5-10]|uniref:HTH araC/xylS-type domain-containing protein n=1 Tax=Ereboglobus luteus TaxID=1796921 RepID=A0A2U8E555_9BACT|nr:MULTISPECIES: AraC family transcriptional regulator [Ereboglobus]AWI09652.1 hypothetical protein CKA38_10680 [Ereboglobus luteus]MDF9828072.1 AraC family transcriptional regulator [Ereboglobus sp. PH5-10]